MSISNNVSGQSVSQRIESTMFELYPVDEPGAALFIYEGNKVVFDGGFGLANLESKEAISNNTHFRMASVSKQFTAMVILLLEKQGKLSIQDKAIKYLPTLPEFASDITIRNLMTHTSGIADYENLIPDNQKTQVSDADVLRLVSHSDSLYFQPGTQFRYSNTGFCLLTQIAEKVSGKAYPKLIRDLIFAPLKMKHTIIYQPEEKIFHRAFGYHFENGRWNFADQSLTSATMGDGSVYTSTKEYRKWIHYLWDQSFKNTATNPLYPQVPIKKGLDYGYGWFVAKDEDGSTCFFHSGESTGFHNIVFHNPSKKLMIVLFTNADDERVAKAFNQISSLMGVKVKGVPEGTTLFDFLSQIYGD